MNKEPELVLPILLVLAAAMAAGKPAASGAETSPAAAEASAPPNAPEFPPPPPAGFPPAAPATPSEGEKHTAPGETAQVPPAAKEATSSPAPAAAPELPPAPSTLPPAPPQGAVPPPAPAKPAAATEKAADAAAMPAVNHCVTCHGESELWEGDRRKFFVTEKDLAKDIHWQRGLRCTDCHGGDPTTMDFAPAHSPDAHFRPLAPPDAVPHLCGDCHADIEYMRRYQPSPRTDQLSEYWTSGHGRRLKESGDRDVATCVSCHGGRHGIRPVRALDSPVYPTHVAETCATCHADPKRMAGRQYHGRPLGHDQYEKWRQSVHAQALLKKGDLSAATCNDCHGNHGALPPQVDSVANACGTCHGKIAKLFADTRMKHRFEEVGLPGCATCHESHSIRLPSDEMLGMGEKAVCATCHGQGRYGATLAGAETARAMRAEMDRLSRLIAEAEKNVAQAERLGMEVSGPRFDLHKAFDAQVNARTLVHTFSPTPVKEALAEGLKAASEVNQGALDALHEYTARRVWLATSLIPILAVVTLLLLYIRQLGVPAEEPKASAGPESRGAKTG